MKRKKAIKPIAILGAGPAGLMAAHACTVAGRQFAIFSHPVKSKLGGAQFLHHPIPGLTDMFDKQKLKYRVHGDPAVYQEKVYGDNPHVPFVSMSFIEDGLMVPAWSLRDVYDKLWETYSHGINPVDISPQWMGEHVGDFDMMVGAMPRDRLCVPWSNHTFAAHSIQIWNDLIDPNIPDNTIVYDGTRDRSWYRASNIFGVGSTEWGQKMKPPGKTLVSVSKPLRTNCDCWPDLLRVGRYGRWEKGVLAHDGFERVANAL